MMNLFHHTAAAASLPALLTFCLPVMLLVAVISYLLGCVNGSILMSKYVFRDDIRTHGSGNAGLTNFYRTYGAKGIAGVFACDIFKAVISVLVGGALLGYFLGMPMIGELWATMFVLLGHMYPVTFRFKGGKGVLSGVSALLVFDWRIALIALAIFFVLAVATRYVSLGSIGAVVTFLICLWLFYHNIVFECLGIVIGGLMVYAHRSNVVRLLRGTENKFTLHRKEGDAK